MSKLGDDSRTANAAGARDDLHPFDQDILVERLHTALDADEAVQRFFLDLTPTRGPMWVALTSQRLLVIERRGLIGFRPRSLPRPLQAQKEPNHADPCIVVVRASNRETTVLVLDRADADAMVSADATPWVTQPIASQAPPPDVGQNPQESELNGRPQAPPGPAPRAGLKGLHRRRRKPRPQPGPPRHRALELPVPLGAGSASPTESHLPIVDAHTDTRSAGVDVPRPAWLKRARRATRSWFRIGLDPISDHWSAVTEHLTVPTAVLTRLHETQPEVPVNGLYVVVAAFMQWVRIEGRQAGHAQPSVAVDSLWRLFAADEGSWQTFCQDLGLELPYRPIPGVAESQYEAKVALAAL